MSPGMPNMRGASSAATSCCLRSRSSQSTRRENEITWLTTGKPVTRKYCLISGTC